MSEIASSPLGRSEQTNTLAWPARVAEPGTLATWLESERDRWFFWLPVAFGVGVFAYFALDREPEPVIAGLVVTLAASLRMLVARGTLATASANVLLAATLGFSAAQLRTELVRAPVLVRSIGPVDVTGTVETVEHRGARGVRLMILAQSVGGLEPAATPRRVRVRVVAKGSAVAPGDVIRFKAYLRPPSPPVLPGAYDFARQAFFQGIGGTGYAVGRPQREALATEESWPAKGAAAVQRLRQHIGARVRAAVPGQSGAIAEALITGERGGISETTNEAYKASGLYHVLSISGLHMVIMAGSVFFALRLVLSAVPAIALNVPIKKFAAVAAVFAAVAYLAISGAAFATVRSAIMISIMFLAVVLDRPALALRNVALAALLILALWPESLLDAGFQMSFAAVVGLVAVYEALRERSRLRLRGRPSTTGKALAFLGAIVLSTVIAGVCVAPLSAFHFHETQQLGILANVTAIPICNLVVMPAALATLILMPFGLEAAPLWIMGHGIDAMTWFAMEVARLPGATARVSQIPWLAIAMMIAGGLWLALWRSRARLLGGLAIAAGMAAAPFGARPDLIAGESGRLVAVRDGSGRLSAPSAGGHTFELGRWLEHDGDGRKPAEAAQGAGFVCDGVGCTARVAGRLIVITRHPAALPDDCALAQVLVLTMGKPRTCTQPEIIIDVFALKSLGTHAVYFGRDGKTRVETVRGPDTSRPWRQLPPWATPEARLAREARYAANRRKLDVRSSGVDPVQDTDDAARPPDQ